MPLDLNQLSDLEALCLTLIGESRGEPIEGQVAVGNVILNRVRKYKDTIHNVIFRPKQFSCWNTGDPNRVLLEELAHAFITGDNIDPAYLQCLCVARGLINHEIFDNTRNSLHYLTIDLYTSTSKPSWAVNVTSALTKGNQVFFRIKGED